MGAGHRDPPPVLSAPTARVVPDVASFSVDDGFAYSIPSGLDLEVGSIVRVPLGGRRVRGWVVAVGVPPKDGLRPVISRSGDLPVFDRDLLGVLRWAAAHYIAPLATLIAKAAPPNLPRRRRRHGPLPPVPSQGPAALPPTVAAAVVGKKSPPAYLVGPGPWSEAASTLVGPVAAAGRSSLVVASTYAEAGELAAGLRDRIGERVVFAASRNPAATQTAAWVEAATRPGIVLVGTREVALWPLASPGLAVVIDEGRPGMKDKATPTVHARDLMIRRAAVQRFPVVMTGLVPSAAAMVRVRSLQRVGSRRPWGLVDVVDRRTHEGLVTAPVRAALRSIAGAGRRAFVLADRRVAAVRCVRCRTLRRCGECGSHPGEGPSCLRCGAGQESSCGQCGGRRFEALGAPVSRIVGDLRRTIAEVGPAGSGAQVEVGTEADLPVPGAVDLGVAVDVDGYLLAPHFGAFETALRVMGRLVAAAGTGRGRRGMLQTSQPDHPALEALRRAEPEEAMRGHLAERTSAGLPPAVEMLVIEAESLAEGGAARLLEAVAGKADVSGPADLGEGRLRWLVSGPDLDRARISLRSVVGAWRDGGATVRIEADPARV